MMLSESLGMKLCYVEKGKMWFTHTPIDRVWGDDWNDAPYEYNAGDPYEEFGPYYCMMIEGCDLSEPCTGQCNSQYTVEAVNAKAVPWVSIGYKRLYNIFAGDTIQDVMATVNRAVQNGEEVNLYTPLQLPAMEGK